MKLLFWRRLAAAWIDVFLVYAVVSLALTLSAFVGLRLALEPLFVVMASAYGAVFLCRQGQTFGKALLGLVVESTSGKRPGVARVLAREFLGKWLVSVLAPVAVGRVLLKGGWVPTILDGLVLGLVLVLLLGYSLLARRPWYDSLAGTVVRRAPAAAGSPKLAAVALLAAVVLAWGAKGLEYAIRGHLPCRLALHQSMRSTKPYVRFLERRPSTPVDYVLGLFDRYDVVVLCERMHPEAPQWDFIFEVVKDPRFVERVGQVFTEYGNSRMQPVLDQFMATDGLSPTEVQTRVVELMRHWSVWPAWNNVNFYTYLNRLYALNQTLPPAKRIRHYFTDVAVDWGQLTAETMPGHWRSMANRDEVMAKRVIEEMQRLAQSTGKPPKCLVVMNFRHAFDLTGRRPGARRENTFEFIKDAFQDRAANVLLNTSVVFIGPIACGLWDAAFEATENRPAGFDFAGSPFGEDRFDLFLYAPPVQARFRYCDVFTGFVFTHPLKDQYAETGIPGYFAGFEPEMRRRAALVGKDFSGAVEHMIQLEGQGHVNVKEQPFYFRLETFVELASLGLASVGFLIGLARLALWRRGRAASNGRASRLRDQHGALSSTGKQSASVP
jgi:RDD family